VMAMERMRELVQNSTSASTELAASSDQMSKMSRGLLDSMDRFSLRANERSNDRGNDRTGDSGPGQAKASWSAAAGSR
jgi:hypothetical protein